MIEASSIEANELKKIITESVNSSIKNYLDKTEKGELLTVTQAAEFFGVSVSTIYGWMEKTDIPHIRPGGKKIFFDKTSLIKWVLNSRKEVSNG